jgi:TolB-like protein/class 3 adenylate cyclase/cytochrome c-type biogenesis protein CcmH/NrfG
MAGTPTHFDDAAVAKPVTRRWSFGPAVLDERTLELQVKGRLVALERKPLEVLQHLLNHAGEAVTKDALLEAVWPGRILTETVLTKCIARLREVLKDDDQTIIKTVHGYGYRLITPVKREAATGSVGDTPSAGAGSRKLAAIMFADIVGYTTLIADDEAKGIEAREGHRKVLQSHLPSFNGRWVEEIGDESFCLFPSALDAVHCARVIQNALAQDPLLKLRIGVHMGDVLERDGRVYGDAVNIAARIRALAVPGGIVVSERVWEDVRNHPEIGAIALGEKPLKNVSRPVRIYALAHGTVRPRERWTPSRRSLVVGAMAVLILAGVVIWRVTPLEPATPASIAVLPFVNISTDKENEYFSDGMTEELINTLAAVEGLRVPSRTSVFVYKGKQQDIREIGKALNVQTVLEGSVRKDRDQLRVTAQLINVADGYHVWSQTYERTLKDVFAVQNELAHAIVGKLGPQLLATPGQKLVDQGTDNLEAYDAYLRGKYDYLQQDDTANRSAIANLEQAVALDPGFAKAYAELSHAYFNRIYAIAPEDESAVKSGFAAAERALALNPELAEAHLARAELLWTPVNNFPHEPAIRAVKRALELDDTLVSGWLLLHVIYTHIGLYEQADAAIRRAMTLDPSNIAVRFLYGTFFLFTRQFELALEHLERVPRTYNPSYWYSNTALALLVLGRRQEASARLEEFLQHYSDRGGYISSYRATMAAVEGNAAKAEAAIRTVLSADRRFGHFHHTAFNIGGAYAVMNRRAEALQWLEYSADTGFPCYPAFATYPLIDNLRGDPEFERFLERTRLEWERYQSLFPAEDAGRFSRASLIAPFLRVRETVRKWMD